MHSLDIYVILRGEEFYVEITGLSAPVVSLILSFLRYGDAHYCRLDDCLFWFVDRPPLDDGLSVSPRTFEFHGSPYRVVSETSEDSL